MAGISFRPNSETSKALALLMERWKCNRSHAINRAIQEAVDVPKIREAEPAKQAPEKSRPERAVARAGKDPEIVASPLRPRVRRQTIPQPDWKK